MRKALRASGYANESANGCASASEYENDANVCEEKQIVSSENEYASASASAAEQVGEQDCTGTRNATGKVLTSVLLLSSGSQWSLLRLRPDTRGA